MIKNKYFTCLLALWGLILICIAPQSTLGQWDRTKISWSNSRSSAGWNSSNGYQDSIYVIVDSSGNSGALSNYPNLLLLNSTTFRKAGNSSTEFSKVNTASRIYTQAPQQALYFTNKSNRAYVPYFIEKWDTTNGCRIWFKFSNQDAIRDTLVMFYNYASAPDCSHLEMVFPAGDDFLTSTYSNLTTIDDSVCALNVVTSWANIQTTDTANQHNAKHNTGRVSNLLYYPTDLTNPYKVATAVCVTGQSFTTDSSQIYIWNASSKNQWPYTPNANPAISDKASSPAGCSSPYLVLWKGATSATDSIFCFFYYDSSTAANEGIYVAATQASDGVTWTGKTKVLGNDGTHLIKNPVVRYESGTWYLWYGYLVETTYNEMSIGLASLTATNPRATFTVFNNTLIIPRRSASGSTAVDSNSVVPVSIAKVGSTYYLSAECSFQTILTNNGIGGLFTGTGGTSPLDATWGRPTLIGEANHVITRGVFTFLDSVDTSTGLGGFLWQQGASDSGAFRFDFQQRIYNETYSELRSKNYYVYGRGTQIPQGFGAYDTIRSQYHVRDSLGYRIFGASNNTYHPVRPAASSGGMLCYNYPLTNDFELSTKIQNRYWKVSTSQPAPNSLFGFMMAVGDTPVISDSVTSGAGATNLFWNYTNARDATGQWGRTFLTGSNYFNINDTLANTNTIKGDFRVGRTGFTATADSVVASHYYAGNSWASYNSGGQFDKSNIYSMRYPQISNTKQSDSVITVFMNGYAVAQMWDNYNNAQRVRSKKFIGWGMNDHLGGAGGEGVMDWWFVRPIQTNWKEPLTVTLKPLYTLGSPQSITVGQGTYDSSYVKDNCIAFWGGVTRYYNAGAGLASANNTSLGFVSSSGIDESRLLIWFSNTMIPYNAYLDSAVIDLYLGGTGNYAGTDADNGVAQAFEVLKDWVEGNCTTLGNSASSTATTKSSATRRGTGSPGTTSLSTVGGTTIASSDSNWFTSTNFVYTDRENFSHIWGISSPDTFQFKTGSDGSHKQLNVTEIVRKQLVTRVNYGFLIRDISAPPSVNNMYCRPGSREESTAAQRPTITYYYRLIN